MKKYFTVLFAILIINVLTSYVYADGLQFVPSESLACLRISNVEKAINAGEKFINEIDSTYKPKENGSYIDILIGKLKNREELQSETGIKMDGDLVLFWPSFNWKNKAYAYQILDKEKTLGSIKNGKKDFVETISAHEGVEIHTFKGIPSNTKTDFFPSNQECYLFIDDYIVNCGDETTARSIINCYKGKNNSITANPKYSNLIKSVRDYEITMYVNAEYVVNMLLPTIQMIGSASVQKAISDSTMDQNSENPKMNPQQAQKVLEFFAWMLEQIESAGFSAHLYEKGIIIDSYLGFKKESPIQNYLVQKDVKLGPMEYMPDNCMFASDSKLNPEILPDIYSRMFENSDTTILENDSTDTIKLRESFMKWEASYSGNEKSIVIIPSSGKFPVNSLEIMEVTNMLEAANYPQKYMDLSNSTKNSEQLLEIKGTADYNGANITSIKLRSSSLEEFLPGINDLFLWHTVIKNKQILCYSQSDNLIKQAIDSLNNGTGSPLVKSSNYQAAVMNLPENKDSVSYLSVFSIMKIFNSLSKPRNQKSCYEAMKNIESAAEIYYKETQKYPREIGDLCANENTKPLIKKRPCANYSIDSNSGKVTCETHGSLESPIPLEKIKDKLDEIIASWEGNIGSIGFSAKNQNYGISENINIPIETIKLMNKIIKNQTSGGK